MSSRPTLYDFWLDIYSRRQLVILTTLSAAVFALFLSANLPPLYESKTVFYIPANIVVPAYTGSQPTSLSQAPFSPAPEEKAASIGIGILRSKDMFRALASEFPERSMDELRKRIDVVTSREFMIEVYVRDKDPQVAAQIANRYPELFRNFHRDKIRAHMDSVRMAAQSAILAIESKMEGLRNPPRDALAGSQLHLSEAETTKRTRHVLAEELDQVRTAIAREETRSRTTREALGRVAGLGDLPKLEASQSLDPMIERLVDLELRSIAEAQGRPAGELGDALKRESIKRQLDSARTELRDGILGLATAGPADIVGKGSAIRASLIESLVMVKFYQTKERAIQQQLKQLDMQVLHYNIRDLNAAAETEFLGNTDVQLRAAANHLRSVATEAALQARQPSAPVVVVEAAVPSDRQIFPLSLLNMIVAGVTGLVFGLYYVLFCGYLDRLRASRIERQMQVPPRAETDFSVLSDALKQRPSTL